MIAFLRYHRLNRRWPMGLMCLIAVFACSASPAAQHSPAKSPPSSSHIRPPSWWDVSPRNSEREYVKAKAEGLDKQLTIDKAVASARSEIAEIVQTAWEKVVEGARQEGIPPPTNSTETDVELRGTTVVHQSANRHGKMWTGFVLVSYPPSLVQDEVMARFRRNPSWYEQAKSTRAVREVENTSR